MGRPLACLFAAGAIAVVVEGGANLDSDVVGGLSIDDECGAGSAEERRSCAANLLQLRAFGLDRAAGALESGVRTEADFEAQAAAALANGVGAEAGFESEAEEGCHDMKLGEGGPCMQAIQWAKNEGYATHPDWYPGLDPETSTLAEWQFVSWNTSHPTCPRPCSVKYNTKWCQDEAPPKLWKAKEVARPLNIKILSYNLFWWNLFKIRGGASAGALIKSSGEQQLYDVIGLQECEDPNLVFGPPGLAGTYTSLNDGTKAICMAYRTEAWKLLANGTTEVADDMRTEYYGRRSAMWMRLKHKESDATVLFVNHHGPLSVNSGGECGGKSTANNLMKIMSKHGEPGDILILVGDFNANAASRTVQSLWPHLLHVYNSVSFGGVDNIFSNVERSEVASTTDLGSGGSDHHAIASVLSLGPKLKATRDINTASAGGHAAEPAFSEEILAMAKGSEGCLIEPEQKYTFDEGGWSLYMPNVADARVCCMACMGSGKCNGWTWTEWNSHAQGPLCALRELKPTGSMSKDGFVSGLPKSGAIKEAKAVAAALL